MAGDFVKHKKNSDTSSVWSYFLVAKDGNSAKCKRCPAILKTLGGSTKGLHTHLSSKHNIKILADVNRLTASTSQDSENLNTSPPPAKRKLEDYFTKSADDSLDDVLARMIALDGFPFSVFITSDDLRKLLLAKYTDLPKSAVTIRKRVMNYSEKIRKQVTAELKHLKSAGERFSLSFDEWTSTSNKRYMAVNVHSYKKFWSLGLVPIHGSMTAENCLRILKERLSKFDISLETDIVAIVTDGPNVMIKVGRLVCTEQQLCLAHGINLAVCDVLYKKKNYLQDRQDSPTSDSDDTINKPAVTDDYMNDSDDDDNLEDLDCPESGLILMSQNELAREHIPELTKDENINELIKKIRKVVVYFKKSPLKNETVLQKYVKIEHEKELSLLLDCKTRWNSLLTMLERFSLLKTCIQKALIDLNHPIRLEDADFDLVNKIVDVLTPIKLTVEAICRRDANLCTADAALKFLIKQLSSKNSALANKMKTCLVERIKQRRSDDLTGVLNYLQNPRKHDENQLSDLEWLDLFPVPTQALVRKQIKSIVKRLNSRDDTEEEERSGSQTDDEPRQQTSQPQLTLKEKLQLEINKSMETPDPEVQNESGLVNSIRREMSLFENGGVRGYHLELAYKYLLSIPPTSVEPERAFSAAAYVGNKLRSRLGSQTLDALIFLRLYFRNSK